MLKANKSIYSIANLLIWISSTIMTGGH